VSTITDSVGARNELQRIVPAGVIAYVDKIHVWLKTPRPRTEVAWLSSQCGRGLHVYRGHKRWDRSREYKQRLQLRQPSYEALQSLATLEGILINYLELALDLTFNSEEERNEAHEFVCQYHVKRWHGEQKIKIVKGSRYTGKRRTPNKLVSYADLVCRITGEVYCVHLEWRLNGAEAVRRAGISTIRELLRLEIRQFWKERLVMRAFNYRTLGRQHNIHILGKGRRRSPWIRFLGRKKALAYDYDRTAGATIVRVCGSTQAVIDEYRKRLDVGHCLEYIDVWQLLPKQWEMSTRQKFRPEPVSAEWHGAVRRMRMRKKLRKIQEVNSGKFVEREAVSAR
jgi:hypothetical protein